MTPEQNKDYAKGYRAGQRRLDREVREEELRRDARLFADRMHTEMVVFCMSAKNWIRDGKPVDTGEERVDLAVVLANHALKGRNRIG